MNREIKFRGRISRCLENAGCWVYWGVSGTDMLDSIDPDTIGQYTGLKDKNGNEIYEGDILSEPDDNLSICKNRIYVVGYGDSSIEHCRGFVFEAIQEYPCNGRKFIPHVSNDCEVIGNILESPELLEKE